MYEIWDVSESKMVDLFFFSSSLLFKVFFIFYLDSFISFLFSFLFYLLFWT